MIDTMIVIAKEPLLGRVKTRLVPPFTHAQAAELAKACLIDTLRVASAVSARTHVLVLEGLPGDWLPHGWTVIAQVAGGLDERLEAAFLSAGDGPALLIGMDTPQVRLDQLTAFSPECFPSCLGLSTDGGYWAIGSRTPARHAGLIRGVPMSTAHTGAVQLSRLTGAGVDVQALDQMTDVDTYEAAIAVADLDAGTDFAHTLRGMRTAALR